MRHRISIDRTQRTFTRTRNCQFYRAKKARKNDATGKNEEPREEELSGKERSDTKREKPNGIERQSEE